MSPIRAPGAARLGRWLGRGRRAPGDAAPPGASRLLAIEALPLRQFERLNILVGGPVSGGPGGEHRSRAHAPSIDFADYRPYRPGDDFRRIDWNVYGRTGALHIKLTEAQERLDLTLALDCSASMRWGEPDKLAFAARVAAALGYVGLARADVVRLVTLGEREQRHGPYRGRGRFPALGQVLEAVGPRGRVELGTALPTALPPAGGPRRGRPLLVLLSDLLAPNGLEGGLDALLRGGVDVVVLHVLAPGEEDPDLYGEADLVDAESGEVLEVALSAAALDQYRARLRAWLERTESACRERGLRYARLRTDRPIEHVLLDDLRAAEVLR